MALSLSQILMILCGVALVILVHNTQRDYFETANTERPVWILWFILEVVLITILIVMALDFFHQP